MSHDHSHHGHSHDHSGGSRRKIGIAAALTGTFMLAEAAGGLISGSLALLADAGHMLVDFAGLALAYLAITLSTRPANARNTFGLARLPILVAFGNGLVLFFIAAVIMIEAARRLAQPVEVLAGPMLAIAIGGLLVNIIAFLILHGGDKEDLNLRGALLHVMGDLLGSVAAIAASLIIMATGWMPIDPILSVLVCLIILGNAWRLVRDSGHILLEGAPEGIDAEAVRPALSSKVPGLEDIHHFHVWTLTPKRRAATLHARVAEGADEIETIRAIKAVLREEFAVAHTTVEVERGVCADEADHAHGHEGHDHEGHAEPACGTPVSSSPAAGRAAHTHKHSHSMIGQPA
ncbi:cation diffusion facilitator family transporter [Aureimonas mangrovi]|uniref:cation diffusion facilitator family transporter n=1 Tax=Aureimonas mangrovi TaxID=2758041 RepID=UPI00163D4A8C|nr:cation diffusion facilitator family transporter [Aureimonas mangrovi]